MGIRGSATTNQTRLLAHIPNVLTVTNPTRLRQRQHTLVDYIRSSFLFASISTGAAVEGAPFPAASRVRRVAKIASFAWNASSMHAASVAVRLVLVAMAPDEPNSRPLRLS